MARAGARGGGGNLTPPDQARWRAVRARFDELVDLDPAQQRERLSRIGATDPDLRRAVESLLAADATASERLVGYEFPVSGIVRGDASPTTPDPVDPLRLTEHVVSHFRVLDFLASGGMGAVYRAEDLQLQRQVALKFPLPHQQVDARVKERFLREARSAALLDHPNLCSVYEVGESPEGVFLAMPLYPGETLKQRLAREGTLPTPLALAIVRQIVTGLGAAHAAGIIHRDLKPGNVMVLPSGGVKILDFGLAKVRDISQTTSKTTLGTVSYMAPEQIRGTRVDERADLWSVGVLLYEMLTGERPFAGEHEVSIAHRILHEEPRPPSALREELRPVEQLVMALLQKHPADRYRSAEELLADVAALERGEMPSHWRLARARLRRLRRKSSYLAIPFAILVVAAVGLLLPELTEARRRPTKNPEALQFYEQGRVYERQSTFAAAESLYHRALALDSGFALARARLAVVYAACRAGGSRDCYRSSLTDRPVYQLEQISTEALAALRQEPGLADAHFAMGLYWEQREEPGRALAEFGLARQGLGKSGELHAAIGRAHRTLGRWDEAIKEFERALTLDPGNLESAADLATTYSRQRRYEEAIRSLNRFLSLVPDAYDALIIKGNMYLRWQGTIDTLAAIVKALPPDWQKRSIAARVLVARIQQRPAEALAALDEAPRRMPNEISPEAPVLLRAQIYADLGDSARARSYFDSARVTLETRADRRPDDFRRQVALGLVYAGLGRAQEAKRAADSAMALMPPSRAVLAGSTAMRGAAAILAQLPEHHAAAIELLDRLLQMPAGREASVPLLRIDPAWAPLRADPRFQRMLQRYSAK